MRGALSWMIYRKGGILPVDCQEERSRLLRVIVEPP